MGQHRTTSFRRTLLALGAALVAIAICIARGHVHVILGDSTTYASPFEHRCGQLMLVCIAWALCEIGWYLRPPALRAA
jgi:hypothetical protein